MPNIETDEQQELYDILMALWDRDMSADDAFEELDPGVPGAAAQPQDWQPPSWQALTTYPRDRNTPLVAWFWHEGRGLIKGYIHDVPSGTRVSLEDVGARNPRPPIVSYREAAYAGLVAWMPKAPMPSPPSEGVGESNG